MEVLRDLVMKVVVLDEPKVHHEQRVLEGIVQEPKVPGNSVD